MQIPKKLALYKKALRIMHRELHKLDLESQKRALSSQERFDVVKILKALETDIKAEENTGRGKKLSASDIRKAREAIAALGDESAD